MAENSKIEWTDNGQTNIPSVTIRARTGVVTTRPALTNPLAAKERSVMADSQSITEYRDIKGFPGYRVGSDGTVWSCWRSGGGRRRQSPDWIRVSGEVTRKGYLRVSLRDAHGVRKRESIHRIVLLSFVGLCPDGMEGCHNDGNPANNSLSNLRWGTPSDNWADRKKHGRGMEGDKHALAKLNESSVLDIRAQRSAGVPLKELADRYGVSVSLISLVAKRKSWGHING